MSNNVNTNIRERALEAMEYATNSSWADQLQVAIDSDDLDQMRAVTREVECYRIYNETIND